MLRSVLLCGCLALMACQTPNPYTAESLPAPSGAPPAPLASGAAYCTGRWERPPAGTARYDATQIGDAVAAGLERRGRRQQPQGDADRRVRARLHETRRLEQVVEPYAGYGYGYWRHHP